MVPGKELVRQIFNDTYNVFYKKWIDISKQEDWDKLMQDVYELNDKYNCSLCRQILLELVEVIESDYKARCQG